MNRYVLISIYVGIIILAAGFIFTSISDNPEDDRSSKATQSNNSEESKSSPTSQASSFVQCLDDAEIVVYGSRTCPACHSFAEQFGGFDAIAPIYVECSDNPEECANNMQTNYVPEIQFSSQLLEGQSTPESLAEITGCQLESDNE